MESQTRGGTRWRRFAVVMVPSVAATAAIGVAVAQGALAASFSVSGQQFKVQAGEMVGYDFVQYGALDKNSEGPHPVAVVGLNKATISNLCQSVVIPIPGTGKDVSMVLRAGQGKDKVEASKLYIDADVLKADAEFEQVDIGVSVNDTTKGAGKGKGPGPAPGDTIVPGSFAQQAEKVTFRDAKQRAWATSAGTFNLKGLKMGVSFGKNECFKDSELE
ncbi:cholesterol esterase [Streptomyces eurocidicus]|uniref:Cholesterol esterase n=1 Tax=Streptomyces eurocidicus TaxID=66423 RepID=A0A2N8NQV4_STREU|nr:DUF6230 family protein [Streptomyces eurocidicus]MBB5116913.1 hypothetical protein [Streptomyces eurocidicus]MBF6052783.1 cholesterol esterase [Streptomyces eurocidicus]PNE31152.1 cholesterol esterase [Streptomyces eurocidicus]